MLLSGRRTDALCFCVQSLPLAERLQLKGQLRAAHNGVMVVVKVFVVIAGQRTGFLRRDDADVKKRQVQQLAILLQIDFVTDNLCDR